MIDHLSEAQEGLEPTSDLYDKYVRFWTEFNNDKDWTMDLGDMATMNIKPFEEFVRSWRRMSSESQERFVSMYEMGHARHKELSLREAETALQEFNENPDVRASVEREVEAALAHARRRIDTV